MVCASSALKLSLQCAITLAYTVALPTPALMLVNLLRSVLDLIWCVFLLALGTVCLGLTLPSSVARSATSKGLGTAVLQVWTSGPCSYSTCCRHHMNSTPGHSRSGSLSSDLRSSDHRPRTCRPLTRPSNSSGYCRE